MVQLQAGEDLVVMGMLAGRRDELGRARTQASSRLHRLLLKLFPAAQSSSCPHSRPAR